MKKIINKTILTVLMVFTLIIMAACSPAEQSPGQPVSTTPAVGEETVKPSPSENTVDNTGGAVVENPADNEKAEKAAAEFAALIGKETKPLVVMAFIKENIEYVSTDNAAAMVLKLDELQAAYLPVLEELYYDDDLQAKLSEGYMKDFKLEDLYKVQDEAVQNLLTETREGGYKVETAEGMFFPIIDYGAYQAFSKKLPEDLRAYVDIMAVESGQMPAKDAALVIRWDEVVDRALTQERFIVSYPQSAKVEAVDELLRKYKVFTFFGLNNTPLIEYETDTMREEAKTVYLEKLSLLGGSTESTYMKQMGEFMDILRKSDYKMSEEADKYRKERFFF